MGRVRRLDYSGVGGMKIVFKAALYPLDGSDSTRIQVITYNDHKKKARLTYYQGEKVINTFELESVRDLVEIATKDVARWAIC